MDPGSVPFSVTNISLLFPAEVDLCCSADPSLLEVYGIQDAFCTFQISLAHYHSMASPRAVCWALSKRDRIIWPLTGAQKSPNTTEGTWHLMAWSLWAAVCSGAASRGLETKSISNIQEYYRIWCGPDTVIFDVVYFEHLSIQHKESKWILKWMERKDERKHSCHKYMHKLGSLLILSRLQKLFRIKISPA